MIVETFQPAACDVRAAVEARDRFGILSPRHLDVILRGGIRGGTEGYVQCLVNAQVAGPTLTASTTPTSILPPAARYNLPGNFFDKIGKALRITVIGQLGNIVTTPGTFTPDVRMGPTSNIVVFNGGAIQLNAVAKTALPFWWDVLLTCRAIGNGTNANLMGQGRFQAESVVGSPLPASGGSGSLLTPATSPAVGTGFDSTVGMVVDVFGTFSLNNANAITVQQYFLESLN